MASDLLEKIYNNAPTWFQNVMISAQGWQYRYRRENSKIVIDQLNFLLKTEHWSHEKFQEYQVQQLRQLLGLAFKQVPYYRQLKKRLGCEPEDFKAPEDIRFLPVLEKREIRGHEHLFLDESVDRKKCTKAFTSGTTGTPLNLYYSQEAFSQEAGFVARLRRWAGLTDLLVPRRAQFTGRNLVPPNQNSTKFIYWRWNIPGKALLFSTTHISQNTVPHYVRALFDFKPELIDGYPSAMLIIARVSRRLGLKLPRPKAIIVSAETLWPEHRRELEEAFQCKVFNQYAGSEPTCLWCDCEYGVMHMNPESGISEIVDSQGNPVREGESGEVLTTSFLNPVMPLIRYRLGDIAVQGPQVECQCGRAMPRIEQVEGRVDDILFVPERGYVGRLDPVFKGLSNIFEAQIIQEDLDHIRILIVPDLGYNDHIENLLIHNLPR